MPMPTKLSCEVNPATRGAGSKPHGRRRSRCNEGKCAGPAIQRDRFFGVTPTSAA